MKVTNVMRRVWTDVLVKVVLHCKIFIDDLFARARLARRQFRGLSDWLGRTGKFLKLIQKSCDLGP